MFYFKWDFNEMFCISEKRNNTALEETNKIHFKKRRKYSLHSKIVRMCGFMKHRSNNNSNISTEGAYTYASFTSNQMRIIIKDLTTLFWCWYDRLLSDVGYKFCKRKSCNECFSSAKIIIGNFYTLNWWFSRIKSQPRNKLL